ncbi:MAG: anaerobic ribonucleoside-triphosphate reductase activating protein [Candidatus Bathyarchaeia archaeon]
MIIKGLQKFTLIDYPGKLACTIFTFGCNFRCPYCQNPELIIDDGRKPISIAWILNFLYERKSFLDGVCITGGEPTIQSNLTEFIKELKRLGYSVKLDTNGSNPELINQMLKTELVDFIAMDVKAPLEKYKEVTKVDAKDLVKKSIRIIIDKAPEYEFRLTVVPGLINEEDLHKIGEIVKGAEKIYIQQFRNEKTLDESFKNIKPFTKEKLLKFKDILKDYVNFCDIRGV